MKLCPSTFGLIALFLGLGEAQVTWPNAIDELEDVMFLNTGYRSRGFGAHVTPCGFSEFGPGRQTAAEWLRIGFHDMATTNVYIGIHGGIDASIQFELNDGENIGLGFNTTLVTYGNIYNSRLSVADLIALGVYASTRSCGGPIIPMRGGRIDVTVAGQLGVPQPQNGQGLFINQFTRMGFNVTDMVQMTACGHTLGGVHAGDFPNIVAPGTVANDFQLFDNTEQFDNSIATRYINGPDTDPLAVGISVASGRNADFAVFSADNATLQAMTNAATFNSMCQSILQRMIEVVDPTKVTLSPIIAPYEVKPEGLQLTLLSGGATILFTGDIRVRTTTRSVSSVSITYLDRNGAAGGTITTTVSGTASGFDDSFTFYGINANLPSSTSISAFTVLVTDTNGNVETFNNNAGGFPISDAVIVQTPQSCFSNGNLTVLAAVRATVTTPVSLNVTQKVPRTAGSPIVSPVPSLVSSTFTMVQGAAIGPYNIYSGSASINSASGTKYDVVSGAFADTFKDASSLGTACSALGTTVPSSTSSSATATPTLAHKQIVGPYTFLGCYTEATNMRALSSASFYNYTGLFTEQCASDCTGYNYFGVEYGGECYCGNVINAGSVLAPLTDCSFICPGNPYEYCGAGNRLEMYELTSLLSSSSSVLPSTSSSSVPSTSSSSAKSSSSSVIPSTSTSSSLVPSTSSSSAKSTSSSHSATTSTSSSLVSSVTISSSSTASNSATASPTLGIKQTLGIYSFIGCYTEATNERALTGASSYDYGAMTLEECLRNCAGFTYFGVEYGGECYCGNVINPGSVLAANQGDCSFICPGNQYEYCGAGNRLEMYQLASLLSGSSSSSSLVSSTTSSSAKSSSSSVSSKSSTSTVTSVSSTSSVAISTTSSTGKSSSTSITSTSQTSKASSSSTTSKSSSSILGSVSSTTSSSSATAVPTLGIKQTIGAYTFQGCWTEATNERALSAASYFDYSDMTLEECANDCADFTYFGVEYGGECYCGNVINPGSVQAALTDCSFICPGNQYEYCGAGNRLELYKLSTAVVTSSSSVSSSSPTQAKILALSSTSSTSQSSTLSTAATSLTSSSPTSATPTQTGPAIKPTIGAYSYYGCQTEGTNIRALTGDAYYSYTAMTLEMCLNYCNGYEYWGVEYGGECYCGNSWNTGSVNAPESDCSFLCPGNDLEYCGAGNRLSAYYLP